jgi:soluble lytic murein transglycosylase-like protein
MTNRINCHIGLALLVFTSNGLAADIYWSVADDRTERFASQPLDATYRLYRKAEHESAIARPTLGREDAQRNSLQRKAVARIVDQIAQRHGVDRDLVMAVIAVESSFNPMARSRKGAIGLMQLMPRTAADYGVSDRADPAQNIEAGTRYLRDLLAKNGGKLVLAIAAYNAGHAAVERHGGRIPPYRETMLFVPAVLAKLQLLRGARVDDTGRNNDE